MDRIGGLYHRNPAILSVAACLLWLLCFPAASIAAEAKDPPPEKGFFKRHYPHWIVAFGMRLVDSEYEDSVGYSTDPLLFSDPPGFDVTVRDWFRDDEARKNWLQSNFGLASLVIGATTVVATSMGQEGAGRRMADDASGLVEVWYFNKGATGLVKNIVGRHRPNLEFIDEDEDLTPEQRQEEEESLSNHKSFFSGATSRHFSMMSYLDSIAARRVKSRGARIASFIGFYSFASYVGYTRMQRDRHYLSDVAAGAAAGIVIGRRFARVHHGPIRGPEPDEQARFKIGSFSVGGGGFSVMVSVRP